MKESIQRKLTRVEWVAEAESKFGADKLAWRFVCPSCGHVASIADWKAAGAAPGEIAFSCVGRHLPNAKEFGERPGPCNYAGGGLFAINPVTVTFPADAHGPAGEHRVFEFAEVAVA